MTHPLTKAMRDIHRDEFSRWMNTPGSEDDLAKSLLLALLRHPAMRGPSEKAIFTMGDATMTQHLAAKKGVAAWRAGIDALLCEVEEG